MAVPTKFYAASLDYRLNNTITKPAATPNSIDLYDAYNKKILVKLVELLMLSDDNGAAWTLVANSRGAQVNKPSPPGGDTGATLLWDEASLNELSFGSAIAGCTVQGASQVGTYTPAVGGGNWIVLKNASFFGEGSPAYLTLQLGANNLTGYRTCSVFLSTHRPDANAQTTSAIARPAPTGPEITYRTGMIGQPGANQNEPPASFASAGVGGVPFAAQYYTTASGQANTNALAAAPAQVQLHLIRHAQGFRFIVAAENKAFMVAMVERVQGVGAVPELSDGSAMPSMFCLWESSWTTQTTTSTTPAPPLTLAKYWKTRRVRLVRSAGDGTAGIPFECFMTQETHGQGSLPVAVTSTTTPNDITSEYPLMPVGLYSNCADATGRHGYIADLYWGSENYAGVGAAGTSYPSDGSRLWVQFGSLVFPWNGGTISLS